MKRTRSAAPSFTLVEILVVVSIIGLLAGLAVPAVGGALASARKAKVSAMAQQVRLALVQFNTEYGYFPTNGMINGVGSTTADLALILTGGSSAAATNANPRRVAFLEVPNDFTLSAAGNLSNRGLVTPMRFYKTGQSNLSLSVDHDYDGRVATNTGGQQNLNASVAVWFPDPSATNKVIGTWK
jgi:prepilin-type N-terminal cleavage/methylation domain-containing protein